jgi:hypothetical protein
MISKEDLSTLRSKNYQLIFNIGVPFSGKKTQCEKYQMNLNIQNYI